ncbi:hypothetical protein [Stigmatella aurantiaca]|uniref:Conserved uncharacterized protein n=1 Tax=Stigmatella aurantiaca (strain DW4/3-1) TaxID=378806 RepID=E3FC63_STIAD|nr:hypothetical protein [Stigmatella aurantiaca]ADO69986.1 conserved uncharacterized protein [Stigmatella aurantiaca DW4/3-1]
MNSASFTLSNEPLERVLHVRMEGFFEEGEMQEFIRRYRKATACYGGQPYLVLADMRSMRIASLAVSQLFGGLIQEARRQGVVCCAHLSSSTVQRLQVARLAREYSGDSDVTVHVTSLEEAREVLEAQRRRLIPGVPALRGPGRP